MGTNETLYPMKVYAKPIIYIEMKRQKLVAN